MTAELIEKRCMVCKMVKPLPEFAMEPLTLGSVPQIKQYGDVCASCRARLKTKTDVTPPKPQKLFSVRKLKKEDFDRGEGGRGKGSRLTIDANSRLFEINKSKLRLAADQQATRDLASKRSQMRQKK